ncbi:MAG: hypothetical protein Q4E34_04095 [Synergistaceae bacterium]|nr:hypothetical protein [Synergistaceae bacterium]
MKNIAKKTITLLITLLIICAAMLSGTAVFAGDNAKLFPRYEANYYKSGNASAIASGQIAMQGRAEEIVLKKIF